ncbi:hypothetical protein GOQ27_12800 [Clostridium sp. D2Q-11]|uniref:VanZ-like domain-containing protein n=1 Tax=Anaeromonas frigoriresistens TaxID=2683708 RepID=A0A942Z827_9FIRM|nr:hypothetical protein [Anaeromonas frigoriresistens]MBS4539347.1 hypothetical protein [Anaeromonas frigoriresistens]
MIYFERKEKIDISNLVKLLIALVLILHLAIGQYFKLYETSIYFDKILHVIGTFTISLFSYQVLRSLWGSDLNSKILVFILISSIGITTGVLLEIFEFSLDMIFNTTNQHGLLDTNLDLIFNIVGAILAAFIVSNKH